MWLCNAVKRANFSQVSQTTSYFTPFIFILSYFLVAELFESHTATPNFPSLFRIDIFPLLVNESSSVIASYKHCSSNFEPEVVKHNHVNWLKQLGTEDSGIR